MKKLLLIFALLLQVLLGSAQAPGCILLEFNGHTITDTLSPEYGYGFAPAFLSLEQESEIARRVTNLYGLWSVTVTTNDSIYETFNKTHRVRVILSCSYMGDVGGWGHLNSMVLGWDAPVLISVPNLAFESKAISEAVAHEVGHTLGLLHQVVLMKGKIYDEYNPGNPFEAPIMGVSYWAKYAIWSKGWNSDGQWQDDEAVISKTFSRRPFVYRFILR